jgi:hypothetical protein
MPASIGGNESNRAKGTGIDMTGDDEGTRHPNEGAAPNQPLHAEMEASARALFAADQADVREAMNSVRWERRGFLRRLTRGSH